MNKLYNFRGLRRPTYRNVFPLFAIVPEISIIKITFMNTILLKYKKWGFPSGTRKKPASKCRRWDLRDTVGNPWLGRSPRGGHDNPLQYSRLENPIDRGAWQVADHGVTKSRTWLKQLIMHPYYKRLVSLM